MAYLAKALWNQASGQPSVLDVFGSELELIAVCIDEHAKGPAFRHVFAVYPYMSALLEAELAEAGLADEVEQRDPDEGFWEDVPVGRDEQRHWPAKLGHR